MRTILSFLFFLIKKKISYLFLFALFPISVFPDNEKELEQFHRFWPDNLFAVEFVTDSVGFIAGYSGTFLRTNDGGNNWEAYYIGQNELIRRLSFVDELTGWAVGNKGSIFHTQDAGETWEVQKELSGIYLRDVSFIDKNTGWVVGHESNIWNTKDGGKTWQQQYLLGFQGRDKPRLHGIYVKDINNAVLVGEFGVIAHTENGGVTWLITPYKTKTTWLSIAGKNETIYAAGLDGNIIRLNVANEDQRREIVEKRKKDIAKRERKARAKAKRLNKEYVVEKVASLPVSEVEYFVQKLKSNTKEHLFDIDVNSSNSAVVVGRSTILKVNELSVTPFKTIDNLPLPFIWFAGAVVLDNSKIWAVGIRGLVVSGDLNKLEFNQSFNLSESNNIKLVTNRWGKKQ